MRIEDDIPVLKKEVALYKCLTNEEDMQLFPSQLRNYRESRRRYLSDPKYGLSGVINVGSQIPSV
jgi:hypothetical protein